MPFNSVVPHMDICILVFYLYLYLYVHLHHIPICSHDYPHILTYIRLSISHFPISININIRINTYISLNNLTIRPSKPSSPKPTSPPTPAPSSTQTTSRSRKSSRKRRFSISAYGLRNSVAMEMMMMMGGEDGGFLVCSNITSLFFYFPFLERNPIIWEWKIGLVISLNWILIKQKSP